MASTTIGDARARGYVLIWSVEAMSDARPVFAGKQARVQGKQKPPKSIKRAKKPAYVYLFKYQDVVKIGFSQNPDRRYLGFNLPYNGEELFRFKSVYAASIETFLHQAFKAKCVKNEWFNLSPIEIRWIEINIIRIAMCFKRIEYQQRNREGWDGPH